jgi:periplasmic protein TonB
VEKVETLPLPPSQQQQQLQPPQQQQRQQAALRDVVLPPRKPVQRNAVVPPRKPAARQVHKQHRRQAQLASAPHATARKAARAVAPAPGAHQGDPRALPTWKSALVARLERYKRYPAEAQARRVQGVAQLAFSVDRSGHVHHARIARSSGSSLLDRATLALLSRAQPLPPPPPQMDGSQIAITVPIRYSLR